MKRIRICVSACSLTALLLLNTTGCSFARPTESKTTPSTSSQAAEQPTISPSCSLPSPESYISDFANILEPQAEDELEYRLQQLKKNGDIDFAVVTIETTNGQTPFDYSLNLARCWRVGSANADQAGALMLVAINDRTWHIQISRKLEQVLTNDEVSEMGSLMAPEFREKQYGAGINRCLDAIIAVLEKRRGFSMSKP